MLLSKNLHESLKMTYAIGLARQKTKIMILFLESILILKIGCLSA